MAESGRPTVADDIPELFHLVTPSYGRIMQAGEGGSTGRARCVHLVRIGPALALCLLIGCAAQNQHVEHALMTERPPAASRDDSLEPYRLACPDEIAVAVTGQSRLEGQYTIGPDGRINLGELDRPRVEGRTTAEAAALIADRAGVPPASVRVSVQRYRSQRVYLVGEVRGLQHSVPYQGPERVAELLQRVGGLTPSAATADVYLIRSHLIDGGPPEVFHVDLSAIVSKHEQRTNIIVQPFDQINVGESRQSNLAHSLPPFLLPFYQSLFGLQPPPSSDKN